MQLDAMKCKNELESQVLLAIALNTVSTAEQDEVTIKPRVGDLKSWGFHGDWVLLGQLWFR